ncbi:cardiolipin synthase [Pseudovibrio sp. Tun.PSC04-5.I4]|uniref:cardiolipin synthase n=1 Tax=Pseudovibrio sp. Tun.PSC04-5.I4 TaxID=1798213 RepID=UPI0008860975|nr:cardiolipin synthase [Pseudovibrio sp. Tun.PSC04-5.I4]SDR26960.1 cardiolipin synthetase 2 [Pseudovibrio sp. Tun.PSC04-5.I4]
MTFILVFHILLVLTFTIRILLRDDLSPPVRLAWFIVLNVLPYVGVGVYFLFGETDLGHRADKRHKEIFDEIHESARQFMGTRADIDCLITPEYQNGFHYAGSINGFYPVAGNNAKLMEDATATRDSMITDIDAAQDYVHVLYYIWLNDHTGTALANALIRATQRGVVCRAMADGLGSHNLIKSQLWEKMKEAGVQLAVALPLDKPVRTLLTSRLDLRNHRKITIIDGKVTYCGSRNSADPEFLVKAKFAPWVDIMLRLTGPIVTQNQLLFISDWMQATGEKLNDFELKSEPVQEGFPAQVMGDGPTERKGATPQLFACLIATARFELTLSTPYFVPDETVLEALRAAAYRGVKVTLIFPKVNDSWIVAAASRSHYFKLLEAGCDLFEFKGGLLHAKTLTMDKKITLIGSSNLDLRSFDLNYENNILLQDNAITSSVLGRQQQYLDSSDQVFFETVSGWSYLKRIKNNVIATVSPIL